MCIVREEQRLNVQECIESGKKTKEILVCGNGFDLHHYLPTRYIDYINVVKRLLDLEDNNSLNSCGYLRYMYGECSPVNMTNEYISKCYEVHKGTIVSTPLDDQELQKLVEMAKRNMWIQYFLYKTKDNMKWIDFEKEIAKVVYAIIRYMDLSKLCNNVDLPNGIEIVKDGISAEEYVILSKFGDIFIADKNRIIIKELYIVYDDSKMPIKIDEEKIINRLIEELNELTESLAIYVEQFVQKITTNKKSSNTLFEKMDMVINFNYTNTFEALGYSDAEVHYIHGSSCDKNIVLGINDDKKDTIEDMDLRFIAFKKYYQRAIKRTDYLLTEMIKKDEIYNLNFVGHSLDVTDRDILVRLIKNTNVVGSTFFYHNEEAFKQQVINLVGMFGKKEFEELCYQNKIKFKPLEPFN